jgi:hypothetical protein
MKTTIILAFISLILSGTSLCAPVNQSNGVIIMNDIAGSETIKLSSPRSEQPIESTRAAEDSKIDGRWTGKVTSPQGEMEITYTFKVDGNKLTGIDSTSMGVIDLTNGVVDGNKFSFDVDVQDMKISHKCEYLTDDTIDVKAIINDQEMVMKLTRVAK